MVDPVDSNRPIERVVDGALAHVGSLLGFGLVLVLALGLGVRVRDKVSARVRIGCWVLG